MPELPEVETVCRGMAQVMEAQTILSVLTRRKNLRVPFPANLQSRLEGHKITKLERRAKYILMHMDNGAVVIMHLGMSGRIFLLPDAESYEPQKHDHLIFGMGDGSKMVFNDARRFGMVMLDHEKTIESHSAFSQLGPEPLGNRFSGSVLYEVLQNKKTNMKAVLMDQRVVAGLGNIYVSEALFYAGIHPERAANKVSKEEAENLAAAIRDVLNRAIAAGGSTLKDYRHADGELGYFQHQFAVYGKEGETCPRCADALNKCQIQKIVQSGRSTYFCPATQK